MNTNKTQKNSSTPPRRKDNSRQVSSKLGTFGAVYTKAQNNSHTQVRNVLASEHSNIVVRVLHFEEEVKRNLEHFVHSHHHFHILPQVFKVSCLTLLSLACISATNAQVVNQADFDEGIRRGDADITKSVKTQGDAVFITGFHDYGDGVENTTWLYLNDQAEKNDQGLYELVINVKNKYPIPDDDNSGLEQKFRFYIGGSLRTGTSVTKGFGEAIETDIMGFQYYNYEGSRYNLQGKTNINSTNFSKDVEGYSVILNLGESSSISTKIYGGRNDLYGPQSANENLKGVSNKNRVEINFGKNSLLFSQIVFGGRSAQKEGVKAVEGFETNENSVTVRGYSLNGKNALESLQLNLPADMVMRAGIWGAEGYETDNNIVTIKDSTIVAQSTTLLQWGIMGGRGYFHERLNVDTKNKVESSISKNNVVIISNSNIGFENPYNAYGLSTDKDGNFIDVKKSGVKSINIFGGYSLGIASDNVVVLENSNIRGEVFGGFELQNKAKGSTSDIRDLNPNLVSLHNVSIANGHSFYGSGTADLYNGTPKVDQGSDSDFHTNKEAGYEWLEDGQYSINQGHLLPVNRRRGVAYLAGKVESDSAYVRYIHFGQYYDPEASILSDPSQRKGILVGKSYYPNITGQTSGASNESGIIRITDSNNSNGEGIAIGQLVGGSYLLNRKGFHSDLTPEKDGNKYIQSDTTIGLHNFWVGTYVNLLGTVDGDGSSLNVKAQLFKDKNVNHSYNEGSLSLLALDDGLVLGGKSSTPVMDRFRDEYTNETGRVLYLGVNDGQGDKAVNIDFGKIQDFRNDLTGQGTKAFGNTQVGLWVNGNGQDEKGNPFVNSPLENGDKSTKWDDMIIHVPGFDIQQGNTLVGKATFGFYKYLHFDGSYDDKTKVKQTADGKEGGVGLKYWLESINILPGQHLVLKGKVGDSSFAENKEDPTTYTLSAYLTGSGNVVIPSNNTVILGDSRVTDQQLATVISGENGTAQTKAGENTYTGTTTVASGAKLIQGSDGALGSTTSYTSELKLEASAGSQYHLLGHSQTVGKLTVGETAEMHFSDVDSRLGSLITNQTTNDSTPKSGTTTVNKVEYEGYFHAKDGAEVKGTLYGAGDSMLVLSGNGNSDLGYSKIYSANAEYKGTVKLDKTSLGLENTDALQAATIDVGSGASLYFNTVGKSVVNPEYGATVGAIHNSGTIYLSKAQTDNTVNNDVNHVYIERNYVGNQGSTLIYRGVISDDDSIIDKIRVDGEASGRSNVKVLVAPTSRGTATDKGILIFSANQASTEQTLSLMGQPIVVAEEDPSRVWEYTLVKRVEPENNNGTETDTNWYLVNEYKELPKPTPDNPVIPNDGTVLRPESGAYVSASQSWAKMHMRLHDRFGQAYYIDPFSGEEKPAAAWVRQVGSHSHFRMNGGESKTHSRTAVTQIGGDLIRDEFNEDWKYIGGIFTGGLYNRANSRSSNLGAKSRTDGYAFGIYGTAYTGNSPDDGFYVDSWLMYGHYNNKVWSDTWPNFKYKSNGWVWSVESGYTIPIGESGNKDYNKLIWTFQPEVQVVWDGLKADDAVDVTGTRYKQLGTNNVAIRVGARLHANYMNKGLGFIEGNWIHNTKKAGVEMSGSKVYMDGGRNLGEFRMGMEGHITKNTLGWATVGAQFGKSGYHNETAQIGIKYMF